MAVKEKRGLGIGLEALFGPELQMLQEEKDLLTLPISKVEPRIDQPRDHFDEERLQDLAASISRHGLIQPVIVRRLDSGVYQIIAGERRWRAARLAGLSEIPVRVLRADDRSVSELALVENLQREDLNPMEEARGYQKLMQDYSLTQEEAAAGVGKSRSAVANALRLLNLSAPVSEMVESGILSAGHARTLLSLEDPVLQKKAADQVLAKTLSVRKTEQLVSRLKKEAAKEAVEPAAGSDEVDYAATLSEELSSVLGRRVSLSEKNNRGKIELFYDNADDREALIAVLRALKKEAPVVLKAVQRRIAKKRRFQYRRRISCWTSDSSGKIRTSSRKTSVRNFRTPSCPWWTRSLSWMPKTVPPSPRPAISALRRTS